MSFLYPRTIAITRPGAQTAVGALPYSGEVTSTETAVISDLPASIQPKRQRSRPDGDVPGDTMEKTLWSILIPRAAAALGVIRVRDIVTDDLGVRYQVMAPYWNSLGYNLIAERLEA